MQIIYYSVICLGLFDLRKGEAPPRSAAPNVFGKYGHRLVSATVELDQDEKRKVNL